MLKRRLERGDTLIEVLFAVTVFSFIVVAALSIMNQGTAASQRALDVMLVRQQLDAQAETLRFMHDSYVAAYEPGITFTAPAAAASPAGQWNTMLQAIKARELTNPVRSVSEFGTCPDTTNATPPDGSFIIDTKHVEFKQNVGFYAPAISSSQISYAEDGSFAHAEGMWIEALRSEQSSDVDQSNTGYIDFYLRACWDSPGLNRPMTLGTIVRLYEPRG